MDLFSVQTSMQKILCNTTHLKKFQCRLNSQLTREILLILTWLEFYKLFIICIFIKKTFKANCELTDSIQQNIIY